MSYASATEQSVGVSLVSPLKPFAEPGHEKFGIPRVGVDRAT
jgi:hypothetical protein